MPQPTRRLAPFARSFRLAAAFGVALGVALVPGACSGGSGGEPADADGPPTLAVLVVVDQLRADLLTRYDTLFTGGIRRLLDQGMVYTGASHRHAVTQTAAGHATLATGAFPSSHGIVANDFTEVQPDGTLRERYSVEDTLAPIVGFPGLEGRSPRNLLRDGLADWVRAANPQARVLSISKKDRAAVTMGGRGSDDERVHVYWINMAARRFVTSAFYRETYPSWVERFNREEMLDILSDTAWFQTTPEPFRALARPDSAPYERDGVHVTFPHLQSQESGPREDQRNWWYEDTPYPDQALVAFAARAMDELQLGQRGVLDFLAVSFSQTDYIGHDYGPLSQEQLDNLLHLDRVLDEFLTLLDARVGPEGWVLGFSADHGVATAPEFLATQGLPAQRIPREYWDEVARRVQQVVDSVQDEAAVPAALARSLEELPYVEDALTPAELESPADSFAVLYRNSDHPRRLSHDLPQFRVRVRRAQYSLTGTRGASHGSPYWYDRWVPLALLGAGVEPGRSGAEAYTVDLAPTLARLVELEIPVIPDGRALGGGG